MKNEVINKTDESPDSRTRRKTNGRKNWQSCAFVAVNVIIIHFLQKEEKKYGNDSNDCLKETNISFFVFSPEKSPYINVDCD